MFSASHNFKWIYGLFQKQSNWMTEDEEWQHEHNQGLVEFDDL